MTEFDVAVVGDGPAGAGVALALTREGRSVIVLGRRDPAGGRAGEVLAPEIRASLVHLGVWDSFVACEPKPVNAIWSSWGDGRLLAKDFVANPHGPGWSVDRPTFDAMLLAAAGRAGARLALGLRRVAVERDGARWQISAQDGSTMTNVISRFVVDATGRTAAVARANGARRVERDSLVALIARLGNRTGVSVEHDDVLLVESAPMGWWYSSVLPSGELVATLLTDVEAVRVHRGSPVDLWEAGLADTAFTSLRAAGFEPRDFHVRRVGVGRLDREAGPGWIAVGDAAGTIDPLSGAGITNALQGAIQAARAVCGALAGDAKTLDAYAGRTRTQLEAALRIGSDYYRRERRWPDSPFWQRRQRQTQPGGPPWPTSPRETSPTSAAAFRRSTAPWASSEG